MGTGPPKITISIRVSQSTLETIDKLAKDEKRTRSQLVDFAIGEYVARHASQPKSGQKRS